MKWYPIESAPGPTMSMFVVIAINAKVRADAPFTYTSDPVCVWRNDDNEFVRWKHDFAPTHWCALPSIKEV